MALGVADGKEHRYPDPLQITQEPGALVQQGVIWARYGSRSLFLQPEFYLGLSP